MPTKAAISRDWGTSPEYVIKCVKKGCPTESFEAAREWRKAHASSRPPTNPIQIARQLGREKDDDSPKARAPRKKYFEGKPDSMHAPPENSLDDALSKVIEASDESFRLLKEAMIEGQDNKIGVRLAVFNKAQEGRHRAEQAYREELERRRILIPLTEAMNLARRGYDIILSRLRCLPQNVAPRCNPANPQLAIAILETECVEIIADARRAYATVV